MWLVRTIMVVVLIAIIIGFSVYNAEERVAVNILNTRYINVPLIYIAYWAFLFGMLISLVLFATIYFKQVSEIRTQKRMTEALSSEIAALRNRPIADASEKFLRSGKDDNK